MDFDYPSILLLVAGIVLLVIAVYGFLTLLKRRPAERPESERRRPTRRHGQLAVVFALAVLAVACLAFGFTNAGERQDRIDAQQRTRLAMTELADSGLTVRSINSDDRTAQLTVATTAGKRCILPVRLEEHEGRTRAYYQREYGRVPTHEKIEVTEPRTTMLADEAARNGSCRP